MSIHQPTGNIEAEAERQRLLGIYAGLREKLLDLTLRNPMLNYKPLSRSRRHLQIIDDVPEDVIKRLIQDGSKLDIVALPEPPDIPEDEKTEEFSSQLAYLKSTDENYQSTLKDLAEHGRDNEFEIAKLDRSLRGKVRNDLGLPSRPDRKQLDLSEHARQNGIDPSVELQKEGQKTGVRKKRLQTLLLPENLEARLETVRDLARLSEQEMGFSTLFLAFGFLEWRQSENSAKEIYAPLLLLPVALETKLEAGKKIYSIHAASEAPEANITLIKHLEGDFNRALPDYDPDEDEDISVESYLSKAEQAIDGLRGWRVRRFLTLGHFAFGRLAMYQDLDTRKWDGLVENPLVSSILSGIDRTEQQTEQDNGLPVSLEPYDIDSPEIEASAPFLVHDADASQHSAIVDVMRDLNLVIEGPPGTGKSQTITNIIANALARNGERTVLFLSDKLAALQVVKRRLDAVGLGDFCLELHSEKSSSKQVVESLAERLKPEKGRAVEAGKGVDKRTWDQSRKEISSYLQALHSEEHAGETAYSLFARAVAQSDDFLRLPDEVRRAGFPEETLQDPESLGHLIGQISHYEKLASGFLATFGCPPSQTVWAPLGLTASPGQSDRIVNALVALRDASTCHAELSLAAERMGFAASDDLPCVAAAISRIPDAPDAGEVPTAFDLEPRHILDAVATADRARALEEELARNPLRGKVTSEVIEAAKRLSGAPSDPSLRDRTCAEITAQTKATQAAAERIAMRIEGLIPVCELLGLNEDIPLSTLDAVGMVPAVAAAVPEASRGWLSWAPSGDAARFAAHLQTWKLLSATEEKWAAALHGYRRDEAPAAADLIAASNALADASAPFIPFKRAKWKKAKETATDLGVDANQPSAAGILAELAEHLKAIEAFERSDAAAIIGPLWTGMATPFPTMEWVVKARDLIRSRLANHPGGPLVADALLRSSGDTIKELVTLKEAVAATPRPGEDDAAHLRNASIGLAMKSVADARLFAEYLNSADPGGVLGHVDVPLSSVLEFGGAIAEGQRVNAQLDSAPSGWAVRALLKTAGDAERIAALSRWIEQVRALKLPDQVFHRLHSPECGEVLAALRSLKDRAVATEENARRLTGAFESEFGVKLPPSAGVLIELSERLLAQAGQLADFLSQASSRRSLVEEGLGSFLTAAEQAGVTPEQLREALENVLIRRRAERAKKNPRLADARATTLNAHRETFAEQDKLKIQKDRLDVRAILKRRMPRAGNNSGSRKSWTEMALLNNEMKKSQRFTNVRSLLGRAPMSIRALKPCFMMSPLSVSKFIPRNMKFDLVIIDEASQMRPEDALGALLRARQIVVVGDPKQLPPTDFFNRVVEDQDEDELADDIKDESILEACSKSFNRLRSLKWHYRSRCESLIDFSNREFYEKSLITFPMARPNSFSIDLVQVDGIYEANQNAAEAQRICEEAIGLMRRMADAPADEFGTIIIVTINSTQRERIKEEFRRLAAGDAAVERFMERAEAKGEPFDVKNLENVQGDERDFVMISLVYGREAGRNVVKQTFGPINRSEGHRRLNVLFSRARRRIGLFTSMRSTDIRPTEQSKRGVHVLKGYLEYAERRGGPDGVVTGKDYDSPFEQAVAERLRAKGLDLDIQVGVSRFRVDLAVRHPMEPSAYVVGIECDGAAYHSSKSARDRDRLREEVLRDLKWEILRVWSTDWFEDPDRETNRLVERINALASKPIRMPDEVMFGSGEISPVAAEGQAQPITVPDDEHRPGQFELTFQEPPKPTKPVGPSLLSGTGKLTRAETKIALEELRRLIETEMPDAEPHRGILREAMIEHFIGGRIDDPSKWFARIPTFIRQGCDPAQKNAYLDRICEVVDRMV